MTPREAVDLVGTKPVFGHPDHIAARDVLTKAAELKRARKWYIETGGRLSTFLSSVDHMEIEAIEEELEGFYLAGFDPEAAS